MTHSRQLDFLLGKLNMNWMTTTNPVSSPLLRPHWVLACILLLAFCTCSSPTLALLTSTTSTGKHRPGTAFVVPRTCAWRRATAAVPAGALSGNRLLGGTGTIVMMLARGSDTTILARAERVSFSPAGGRQAQRKGNRKRRILDQWRPLWAKNSGDDDEDDSSNSESKSTAGPDTTKGPPRIRAKFDRLFAGMPSMQDILRGSSEDDDDDDDNDDENAVLAPRKKKRDVDDSWFQTEQQLIRANYDRIFDDMLVQLAEERRRGPEAIPDNAEALIRSVLQQEMEREIAQTRNDRIEEMVSTYEVEQRRANDAIGSSELPLPPESVQKMMRESEAEFQQQEANRLEIEDFLRYEQEAVWKSNAAVAAEELESSSGIRRPEPDEDLDRWALERLKEMAGAREDSDGDEMILDILQDNVQDLEDRIRKETSRTGSMLPETMKEWQMYRAIATRLTRGSEGGAEDEASREAEILLQLDSWKDYIQKEEGIRRQSGLTRGPKMPFAWQEQDLFEREIPLPGASDKQSRINTRKQLNRMSIEAMESLLSTPDLARRERLQKEVDFLKATLEDKDYLDVDESFLEDTTTNTTPVDVSGVFQTSTKDDADSKDSPSSFIKSFDTSAQSSGTGYISSYSFSSDEEPASKPPSAQVFEEAFENAPSRTVPPPNTAFFADSDDGEPDLGETFTGDSKLGTMEDQKLEAMYRRAGARTTEERAAIRSQWEEFQAFEKTRRDQSGLSGDDDVATAAKTLNYNIADVVREDGDIDAEAILAAIGPRPSRKKKSDSSDPGAGVGETVDPIGTKEVMNSLYRAVEAVGGGRYRDDPDAKAKQQAAFEQYMLKEKAMRESLDDPNLTANLTVPSGDEIDVDDPEYAEEVLSAIGSRPKPKIARKIDPGDYSDKGGILSSDDYDDIFDSNEDASEDNDNDETEMKDSGEGNLIPEWLRKENEEVVKKESGGIRRKGSFLGSEIDQVFDDTDYEHNMRQLAEYEKRRAGRGRQMGIDISDVLGRSTFDTDDYADYKFEDASRRRGGDWGSASFASRKANLLEYTELDIMELNSLMDHKSSVYSTGVSQYLPRINKPFSAFGAVFRMEGVLLNVDGLQLKAWTKVANQYGFKAPTLDEVRQASVTRPAVAVKDIFVWTDDILECRDVAFSHKQVFKEIFKAWKEENGIIVPEISAVADERGGLAIGAVAQSSPQPTNWQPANEDEKLDLVSKAWAATAEAFGKKPPRSEEIVVAASLSPDIAVRKAFGWTVDPLEVDSIVYMYRKYLRAGSGKIDPSTTTPKPSPSAPSPSNKRPLTQTDVMEMHYHAWNAVAELYGFQAPSPDEVLAAFVINEPEAAAQAFGWSDDPQILRDVASAFSSRLEALKGGVAKVVPKAAPSIISTTSTDSGPSQDEIFNVSFEAWRATARKNGFRDPDVEEVLFALTVGPDEAIMTGFRWTPYPAEAARLVESYKSELEQRRPSWLKKGASSSGGSHSRTDTPANSRTNLGQPSSDELYLAVFNSWTDTAKKLGFPMPDDEQVVFAMSVGAEEAVVTGFGWTNDRAKAREIVESYKVELSKRRSDWVQRGAVSGKTAKSGGSADDDVPMVHVHEGAAKWVKSLLDVEMQCGVVSYLERDQVNALLVHAGMDSLFPPDKRVSASNGYPTDKDQLLGAALRLERRPDHCVVFDSTPYASVAAHDVGMQSVSLIGPYPRYELLSSDTTANSFDDLTAMNIRRLFSERVYDQPLVESAQNQPEKRAITKTRFFYDDD